MRRLAIGLGGLLLSGGALLAVTGSASGQESPAATDAAEPAVDIVEMSGLVDDVVADGVTKAIERAEEDGAEALVIQLNSKGAVVSPERLAQVAGAIHGSSVPVAIWVGPSGARALGGAGQLLGAAPVTAMAPATRLGSFGDPLPVEGFALDFGDGPDAAEGANATRLRSFTMGPDEARQRGVLRLPISDVGVPVLRNMLLALDGLEYGGRTLNTAEERVSADGSKEQVLVVEPRFYKLPLVPRLMHTVASPPVTYLLLAIGLSLLIFEFFTAGVGVAGVVGAGCVVLACYGLGVLPVNGWALALLFVAFFGLAIDVQTGVPRAVDRHRARALRRGVPLPVQGWAAPFVDHAAGGDRGRGGRVRGRDAVDGPGSLRHADHRAGVDDRGGRGGDGGDRPGRDRGRPRCPVAGPHEPGHASAPGGEPSGHRHRRVHARGRAGGGRGPRPPRAAPHPPRGGGGGRVRRPAPGRRRGGFGDVSDHRAHPPGHGAGR